MSQLSGNSCNIITLLPLGLDCESISANTPYTTDGLITLFVTGGTPPYTINWSNGSQGSYLFNLAPGDYTATVIDYYGDFTATTTCSVGYENFYLEKFQNCVNSATTVYYVANMPSTFITDKVYRLQGQTGCWESKGLELTSGQTYVDSYAVVTAGPYPNCKGCLPIDPVIPVKPEKLCLEYKSGGVVQTTTYIQFSSGGTINNKNSWTSVTPSYVIYYNSGSTNWQISGWTGSGNPTQVNTVSSPLGSWVIYGGSGSINVVGGTCVIKPNMFIKTNSATCSDVSNGSVVITAIGGTPPYEYSLDGVLYQPSSMFIGLSSGNYTAYVKDSSGATNSQSFTINASSTQTTYTVNLYQQPIATPIYNNTSNYTQITYNWYADVTPPLPSGKTITFDIIQSVNSESRSGYYNVTEVFPTLQYSSITGVTGGGSITATTTTTPVITSPTSPTCVNTISTTAYTNTYKALITGIGNIYGQINKKITTPNGTVEGCPTYGLLNDTINIANVKLVNASVCELINTRVPPLPLNLSRTGGVLFLNKG
jgi:hypothetical protein